MTIDAWHGTVAGHVQGVGFRYSLRKEATRLGIAGWVRNRSNGTVEFHVQGEPGALETLMRWTAAGGPRGAHVRELKHAPTTPLARCDEFEIHPSVP
jgi:acylphosphatase